MATPRRGRPPTSAEPIRYALRARPGRVSSWLTTFAASPTSTAPVSERVRQNAHSGMPTSFSVPVVVPARRCARKPRSGPLQRSSARPIAATGATEGTAKPTSQPTSGSRRPPVVAAQRARRERELDELAAAVNKAAEVAAGGAVPELELDLAHVEPVAECVDRHPRLDAEPGRDREEGLACALGQHALARQRLAHPSTGAQLDQRARDVLRDAQPAPHPASEGGDGNVGVRLDERA